MIELTEKTIDPQSVYERLSSDGAGSMVVHFAVVKPISEGKRTAGIRFAPNGNIEGEMKTLETELREEWDVIDMLLIRRMGKLCVGDIVSVVAVSAPGRESAFGASCNAVDKLKKMKCVRKEELFEDK